MGAGLRAAGLIASGLLAASCEAAEIRAVTVEGTSFAVALADGRVLRSPQLVGAVLTLETGAGPLKLRIDAVEPDPGDDALSARPSGDVWLHSFFYQDEAGAWRPYCEAGPDGRRQGFPLAGRALPDAAMVPAAPDRFEIVCTGGARGKCVRFGYRPWRPGPEGASMWDLFNACVRLVRADYAGDGRGTTRDGMRIDIYDRFGVQTKAALADDEFEAGFTAAGAVCVGHPRVKENVSLAELEAATPRLRGRTGAACTEEAARDAGASLFVRSPP